MNGLVFNFSGSGDEIILSANITVPSASLFSEIYLSDKDLGRITTDFRNAMDFSHKKDIENINLQFGPELESSPSCKIEILFNNLGVARISVQLKTLYFDSISTSINCAKIHFMSDIASIDIFLMQLTSVFQKKLTSACLRAI